MNFTMSFMDQLPSGRGILFFNISVCSECAVTSQSVIRWCMVSYELSHRLHIGEIFGSIFDWK